MAFPQYLFACVSADTKFSLRDRWSFEKCEFEITRVNCILSCAYMSLLQAKRCCMLIIKCSNVIFYRVLFFPAASHTLLYAYHKLQQGNILSCAKISFLIFIRCCRLFINCSKVIFYRVLIFLCCNSYVLLC